MSKPATPWPPDAERVLRAVEKWTTHHRAHAADRIHAMVDGRTEAWASATKAMEPIGASGRAAIKARDWDALRRWARRVEEQEEHE